MLGGRVLLVDTDPQGSARDWRAANDNGDLPVIGLDRPSLSKDLRDFSKPYDIVVIDGAPQLKVMAAAAIRISDAILIPVQPTPYDTWATADLVEVFKARQEITEGIVAELAMLGINVAKSTVEKYQPKRAEPPSPTWRTFLDLHVRDLVSVDFFIVPTVNFRVVFVFIVLAHDRRRIVHFNVTEHPMVQWTAQQIVEAFPFDTTPRYLIRDGQAKSVNPI